MDELLRAYAKKRREQAGPASEMHPATRKLLQDEVKRTFAANPAPTRRRSSWLVRWPIGALWPLGWAGGMVAIMLLGFVVFRTPTRNPSPATIKEEGGRKKEEKLDTLTRNPLPATAPMEKSVSEAKTMQRTPAPVPEGTAVPALGASSVASTTSTPSVPLATSVAPQTAEVAASALGAGVAPAAGLPPVNFALGGARAYGRAIASAPPAGVPPTANEGSDVAAGEFVQVPDRVRGSAAASPPSNVLSTFNLSRAGQNVRVVDADGSIYDGQVLGGIPEGGAAEEYAKKAKDANQNTNWAFKVAGTNHHLQQNIVFTGRFLNMPAAAPPGQVAARNLNASQSQNAPPAGRAQSAQQSAQNSRITGQVQVGGGKEFMIEAKPPPP